MKRSYSFIRKQYGRLANILDYAGQVLLTTIRLPPIFGIPDGTVNPTVFAMTGLVSMLGMWWLSLKLERFASI